MKKGEAQGEAKPLTAVEMQRGVMPPCENECYIKNHSTQCGAENDGYYCSRDADHKGKHVACGCDHALKVWEGA
jgi:hypothetical protein